MFPLFVQLGSFGDLDNFAVNPRPNESLPPHLLEQFSVFTLAVPDEGRQDQKPAAVGQAQDPINHLVNGLRLDRRVMHRAMRHADRGPQQPQIIVNLGNGSDGRSGIF